MPSEWKVVPGYSDYMVSVCGKVCGLHRGTAKRVRPFRTDAGLSVPIWNADGLKVFPIRELVALAFMGPRLNGERIVHADGNTDNCSLDNLRYV